MVKARISTFMRGLIVGMVVACLQFSPPASAQLRSGLSVGPVSSWVDVPQREPEPEAAADTVRNGLRFLLYDRQIHVGRGGEPDETYARWSQQIVNESGLQAASQINIEFDPTFQTLVLHLVTVRRGDQTFDRLDLGSAKVVQREPHLEAQVYDGRQTVVLFLSDLRVGDVVDYAYSIRGSDPTLDGRFADVVFLGAPEPLGRQRVRVNAPREKHIGMSFGGPPAASHLEPTVIADGDRNSYVWDLQNAPAYPIEAGVPGSYAPLPFAALSEFDSWHEVAVWGALTFATPRAGIALDAWVKRALLETGSLDAFLLHVLRFVQDEVRYVAIEVGLARRRPSDPNQVFQQRFGDCKDKTALLVAMLTDAGIRARPALVRSFGGSALDGWTPTPQAFDHAIVKITTKKGAVYWADPSAQLQGGPVEELAGSAFERALELDASTTALDHIPATSSPNEIRVVEQYLPPLPTAVRAETELDVERVYRGELANMMRGALRAQTREQVDAYYRSLYEQDFPGVHNLHAVEPDDDRERNIVRVKAKLAIPSFWKLESDGRTYRVELPARDIDRFLNRPEPERRSPLALPYPLRVRQSIEAILPYDLSITPSTSSAEGPGFRLNVASNSGYRTATFKYEYVTTGLAVDVPDLASLASGVDKARTMLVSWLSYQPTPKDTFNWLLVGLFAVTLPAVAWGAARAYRYRPHDERTYPRRELSDAPAARIGGWLVLVGLGVVVAPVQWLVASRVDLKLIASTLTWRTLTTPGGPGYHPLLAALVAFELVGHLVFGAYSAVIVVLFFRRKRTFPIHYRVAMLSAVGFGILDTLGAAPFSGGGAWHHSATIIVGATIGCLIWVPYMYRSRRVARTFLNA